MKIIFDKIKRLFGPYDNLSLENRLYFYSLLIGIVLCLMGSVAAIIFVPSFFIITICLALATFLFILRVYGLRKGKVRPFQVPVVIISFIAIFIIWVKGGGLDGPNVLPNYIVLIIAVIIVPAKLKKYFLFFFLGLVFLMYYIHVYYPHLIEHYPSDLSRFGDTVFTTAYSAIFIYFIIINLHKNYQIERKRAEENENKFKVFYDKAPDMYYSISAEKGIIVNCNETFLRNLGYSREEVMGKPIFELVDDSVKEYWKETFKQFQQTGIVRNKELLISKKDGSRIFVSLNAEAVRDDNGKILYSISSWRDINDQKIAEKDLKNINELLSFFIKKSPIYAFIKDVSSTDSKILYVSDNYENMLGIKASDMVGKSVDELFPPDFARQIMEQDWNVVLNSEIVRVEQTFNNRTYDTIKFPIKLDGKNLLAGYSIDISEQVGLSLTIHEQNKELQELNADKDVFISILAHDLKNPFNALLGFSDLLIQNVRKYNLDKIEKHLKLISANSQKAYNLLEDILLWTRSQSGKIPFELQPVNLNEICTEVIENINLSAMNKKIRIESLIQKEIYLSVDKNMLTTVLRNLLTNAIKFTNWGGFISVSAKATGAWATIVVNDNGVGINENKIDQLFDFTQKNSTSGTGGEMGTGFGLLLCKEFVAKHGGKIWVESEVGKGSSFMFTMPVDIS